MRIEASHIAVLSWMSLISYAHFISQNISQPKLAPSINGMWLYLYIAPWVQLVYIIYILVTILQRTFFQAVPIVFQCIFQTILHKCKYFRLPVAPNSPRPVVFSSPNDRYLITYVSELCEADAPVFQVILVCRSMIASASHSGKGSGVCWFPVMGLVGKRKRWYLRFSF